MAAPFRLVHVEHALERELLEVEPIALVVVSGDLPLGSLLRERAVDKTDDGRDVERKTTDGVSFWT